MYGEILEKEPKNGNSVVSGCGIPFFGFFLKEIKASFEGIFASLYSKQHYSQ